MDIKKITKNCRGGGDQEEEKGLSLLPFSNKLSSFVSPPFPSLNFFKAAVLLLPPSPVGNHFMNGHFSPSILTHQTGLRAAAPGSGWEERRGGGGTEKKKKRGDEKEGELIPRPFPSCPDFFPPPSPLP